jgi:hypothetical protein
MQSRDEHVPFFDQAAPVPFFSLLVFSVFGTRAISTPSCFCLPACPSAFLIPVAHPEILIATQGRRRNTPMLLE